MSSKSIQIVAFNNPYPANFGGAIDMFYKIKALTQLGVKIDLHVFYDDRANFEELETLCETIYRYKRQKHIAKHFSFLPFSVKTRQSQLLVDRLKANAAPIFIESLRCCGMLINANFKQNVAVRNHNIEHNYSWGLSKSETHPLRKLAHYIEGKKQKKFEAILNKADLLFNISYSEHAYFSKTYNPKSVFLPAFQGYKSITSKPGRGEYALYHGDLTTADNLKSAQFLITVFKDLDFPLVIAGSNLPKSLLELIQKYNTISFVKVTEQEELTKLIENAHINTLYSFQESGTKLKVFTALFNGRHCILNKNMVDDAKILSVCEVAETKKAYQNAVRELISKQFSLTEERKVALANYKDIENAKIIVENLL
ncbi:hypothetical protein DFQ05_2120 [Winogradskyella wandonensis]|uniref:Glycosyl transferase family 1 n=1 Tax=Winogradskyella wandonensis TaxID=1442586 RepID=A0A4R1KP61_9FLAO|nr:glycosyltransferase [Winogradskyella wandonensis]TCK66836.1 hypothetical protein DFQ05_2120 [Winogradskyella wandonensis]